MMNINGTSVSPNVIESSRTTLPRPCLQTLRAVFGVTLSGTRELWKHRQKWLFPAPLVTTNRQCQRDISLANWRQPIDLRRVWQGQTLRRNTSVPPGAGPGQPLAGRRSTPPAWHRSLVALSEVQACRQPPCRATCHVEVQVVQLKFRLTPGAFSRLPQDVGHDTSSEVVVALTTAYTRVLLSQQCHNVFNILPHATAKSCKLCGKELSVC